VKGREKEDTVGFLKNILEKMCGEFKLTTNKIGRGTL
jgi:hypothetical protein